MSLDLDAFEAIFSDPDAWAPDDITVAGLALIKRVRRAEGRVERLEGAIRTVLADEESGKGGWGPDITTVEALRVALDLEAP